MVAKSPSPYKGQEGQPRGGTQSGHQPMAPSCLTLSHQQLCPARCCHPSWSEASRAGPFFLNSVPQSVLIGFLVIFRQDLFALGTSPLKGAKEEIATAQSTLRSGPLWGKVGHPVAMPILPVKQLNKRVWLRLWAEAACPFLMPIC